MNLRRLQLWAAVMLVAAAAGYAAAADTESPHVYTNADIERLFGSSKPADSPAPAPPDAAEAAAREAQDRQFVASFLEQERRQIAEEQDRIARQREIDEASRYEPGESYGLPWAYGSGWVGSGWWGPTTSRSRPGSGRTPYFSRYAPKPGQPGWNELVLQQHRAAASGSAGHSVPQGQPHVAPHGGQGHGGGRR